ncbi:putative transcription factor AS2-LOB family [Helianthus annuus]|uniref:Putative LOB domain-containing protein n=2 Tax=Helianthus annuus TaxID=4232 RepID=A0A251S6L1_HELAN|nr:putative transcription factor AS2-LOB family [Helianthus annuus]KAJ0444762.1 putative transcription factor AS2-LOB family [Helianthus annuus]KAJ0461989.1 putative transcription factor AS2-LOB family [Helianthus annuus]KAJ0646259.1 putative transcription factor AS2-LOB family [Helianthus annuus]KAJ0822922.1 putative transcription factor AS2-LOB family [Helianthus annuus]
MQKSQNDTTTIRVLEAATSSSPPSTTTTYGGAVPACAACRHQRKKCTKKCVLAPFFPVEKTQDFQAVHRVFGVSNVTKLLKDLSTEDGKKAVDSLIWEANCRIKDPVLGSLGEFQRVCEELNFYKTQLLANVPVMQSPDMYNSKSAQRLIKSCNCDTNGNINSGSLLDYYIHCNGVNGGIDHSTRMLNYGSSQSMERVKHERDQQGSLIHQQQQMMNDFSEFY